LPRNHGAEPPQARRETHLADRIPQVVGQSMPVSRSSAAWLAPEKRSRFTTIAGGWGLAEYFATG
jgi:hypothetical protein